MPRTETYFRIGSSGVGRPNTVKSSSAGAVSIPNLDSGLAGGSEAVEFICPAPDETLF
jgi:hypothetical protein